jgi:hypothetical protein
MWSILDKTAIGMKLLKSYPNIRSFRISSATANRKDELHKYDTYANRKLTVKRTEVPSFKEYVSNPSKYNPHEVSGGLFKESCWKGYKQVGMKKKGKKKKMVPNCVPK